MLISRRLGIVCAAFLMFTCASGGDKINRSRSSAVIVVRKATMSADTVEVHVNARNGRAPSGQPIPSQVLWTLDDPSATLGIEWVNPAQDCVRGKHCERNECHAVTNTDSKGGRCEYRVLVNSTAGKDPVIVVDDCCP